MPPVGLSSWLWSGPMLLFRFRLQFVLALVRAQTLIAFERSQITEAQEVTQGFQRSSRLQITYRKGVA